MRLVGMCTPQMEYKCTKIKLMCPLVVHKAQLPLAS